MVNTLRDSRIIGNSIRKLLEDKGITANQFVERTQMSERHIKEIVTGSRDAKQEELEQISKALEVSIESLKDGSLAGEADNVHCMGNVKNPENMTKLLDSIDFYVRLINAENK